MAKKSPKTEPAKNETPTPETAKPKKSAAVRQAIAALPAKATAAEIAAEATKLAGQEIGVPTVYAVKSGGNGSTGKKKPKAAASSVDPVSAIVAARSLLHFAGDVDSAKRIIDAMA
jgi:hypothetical protein